MELRAEMLTSHYNPTIAYLNSRAGEGTSLTGDPIACLRGESRPGNLTVGIFR